MSAPVLEVERLDKRYQAFAAVDGVTFHIDRGETLCLLGPSGCGKSTILRMIAGIDVPSEGEIRIAGETVAAPARRIFVPSENRGIGLVFQSYAIWPHMTVAENVGYPLEVRKIEKPVRTEKIREVLEIVGLAGFEERPATQLSGGQQQRVALARALVYSPRLLLLDEPLSNLDARLRDELRNEIKRIQRQLSLTVLYVTHDQVEAMTLADRIVVMHAGKIMQMGSPSEVYDNPCNVFVQNFFGKTYVFEGTMLNAQDGCHIRLKGGLTFPLPEQDKLPDGTRINVSIRAEDVTVGADHGPASPDIVNVPAVLEDVRFLGNRLECILAIDQSRLFVECSRSLGLVPGQPVSLNLARSRIRTWKKEDA